MFLSFTEFARLKRKKIMPFKCEFLSFNPLHYFYSNPIVRENVFFSLVDFDT